IERARPGVPGEPVAALGLYAEQGRLSQPAETDAPRGEPPGPPGMASVSRIREGRLAIGKQRRPEQELSQPSPASEPAWPAGRRCVSAPAPGESARPRRGPAATVSTP